MATHKHAQTAGRGVKRLFLSFSIDPVTLTATPVVGPVKLDKKNTLKT